MTNINSRMFGLLALAGATFCGCDQRKAPAALTVANPPTLAASSVDATTTNLLEVNLVGKVTREETIFSKTGGEERKLVRYMLVTVDGEKWALQAIAAREVLAQVVDQTVTIKGLARGRLVKRITQLQPLRPAKQVNIAETNAASSNHPAASAR